MSALDDFITIYGVPPLEPEGNSAWKMGAGYFIEGYDCGAAKLRADLAAVKAELAEARGVIENVDATLDYLQNLWGKEGITDNVADKTRAFLAAHPQPPSDQVKP